MGTSVTMIERHYGQTRILVGIEHETAKRRKLPQQSAKKTSATPQNDPVPDGAVDPTPALQGDDD